MTPDSVASIRSAATAMVARRSIRLYDGCTLSRTGLLYASRLMDEAATKDSVAVGATRTPANEALWPDFSGTPPARGVASSLRGLLTVAAVVGMDASGMAIAMAVAQTWTAGGGGTASVVAPFAATAGLTLAALLSVGLSPPIGLHAGQESRRIAWVVAMATVVATALAASTAHDPASFAWRAGLAGGSMLPLLILGRRLLRGTAARSRWWGVPTVVVASSRRDDGAPEAARRWRELGFHPVVWFEDDERALVPGVGAEPTGPPSRRTRPPERGPTHAIIVVSKVDTDALIDAVLRHGDKFHTLFVTSGRTSGGAEVGVMVRRHLVRMPQRMLKRAFDLLLVAPAILFAAPIVAIASLAIWRASPGNPFYAQEREGRGGRSIRVWKLRTMFPNAADVLERHLERDETARIEWSTKFKLTKDPRIIPGVGSFLRRTSLDELPQLWNIVRGDMSFVGPRPFPRYHLDAFDDAFVQLRRSVTPGLTGPWQISARSDGDLELQRRLDTHYVVHGSPWLDLVLLLKTPLAVLKGRGAY
jgi:lipopolysaccharide/colanic/teichoic acid biosynthesis glycosyltransferase